MKTATDKLADAQSRRAEAVKASNTANTSASPAAGPAGPRPTPPPPTARPFPQYGGQQVPEQPASEKYHSKWKYYYDDHVGSSCNSKAKQQKPSYKYKYSSYGDDDPPTYTNKSEAKPDQYFEQAQYQQYTTKNSSRDRKPEKPAAPKPPPRRPAPYEQKQPSQPGPYSFNDAQARARNRERVRAEAKRIEEEEREANRIRFREQQLREELRKEKERADFVRQERLENEMRKKRLDEERQAAHNAHKERIRQQEMLRKQREEEEERQRVIQQTFEKQKEVEEAVRAKAKTAATSGTPDDRVRKWGAPHYSSIPIRRGNGSNVSGFKSGIPSTFTADGNGEVRSSAFDTRKVGSSPTRPPPVPLALRCIAQDSTTVELAWTIPQYPFSTSKAALLTELSWKNASVDKAMWEFAPQLLSSSQVRKKNLMPQTVYEFKVRLVFLPRGRAFVTGDYLLHMFLCFILIITRFYIDKDRVVGPWSKAIVVMMSASGNTHHQCKGEGEATTKQMQRTRHSRGYDPYSEADDDVVTGQKLSESVRRAWYDAEKEGKISEDTVEDDSSEGKDEFYPRRIPSFHLGRTMFGKAPSPEPEEIDSDSDDANSIPKKVTPTSSATKPARCLGEIGSEFYDFFSNQRIEEYDECDEDILDETEASRNGVESRHSRVDKSFVEEEGSLM